MYLAGELFDLGVEERELLLRRLTSPLTLEGEYPDDAVEKNQSDDEKRYLYIHRRYD
jgi:nucleoside 2-deoxyribosyltransferase